MKLSSLNAFLTVILCSSPFLLAQSSAQDETTRRLLRAERARRAQEEFYRMRASPGGVIPSGARGAALAAMDRMRARERKASPNGAAGPAWTLIGPRPTLVLAEQSNGGSPYSSGRVAALEVDPRNADVAYMGASGGGI